MVGAFERWGRGSGSRRRSASIFRSSLWLGLVLATLVAPKPAWSGPAPRTLEPTAADRDTARGLMDLGDKQVAEGRLEEALESYKAAHAIMGVPTTGIEIGRTQRKLGLLVEARDTLFRVTRYPKMPGEPTPFTEARAQAVELVQQLAELVPTLRIQASGPTPEAVVEVRLDGRILPPQGLALPRRVNPGTHLVQCSSPGLPTVAQSIALREKEARVVQCVLKPPPEPPPEPPPPRSQQAGPSPLVWIGFGVGAAGLVVGSITGILSIDKVSELEDACPDQRCTADMQSDIDTMNTLANVSNVSFVIAAVGVGVGVVGLALSGDDDEPANATGARLQPVVGPGGVALRGCF